MAADFQYLVLTAQDRNAEYERQIRDVELQHFRAKIALRRVQDLAVTGDFPQEEKDRQIKAIREQMRRLESARDAIVNARDGNKPR